MDQRKRLIELIKHCTSCEECRDEDIVDHLLANGVVAIDLGVVSPANRPLISQCLGHPLDEIIDLIRAKEDGRILPCKICQPMKEQIDIFGNAVEIKPKIDKEKRNWEDRFQRWSTNCMLHDQSTHYGKCGYGSMCDFCEDNSYGRPCVRALNEMCRDDGVTIDYSKNNFKEVWDGDF